MKNKKRIITSSIIIGLVIVIALSITYAYTQKTLFGSKKYVMTVDNKLKLTLNEKSNDISIENVYPLTDSEGKTTDSYDFSLHNPDFNISYDYTIYLIDNTLESGQTMVSDEFIKYYLTNSNSTSIVSPRLLSTLSKDDNGRIIDSGTIAPQATNNYSLRFWIDYKATQSDVVGKVFSVKIKVIANEDIGSVSDALFKEENLGDNCKTYDDGTDTFLVGQCSNNYVWYSGKLWRVVLKNNSTGAVKMVTDNAITIIPNNSDKTVFENSYIDQWLNQEFLPTLHDYDDYLVVNSVWDATLDASSTPSRPNGEAIVTRTVGLLNAYEYSTTYNNSDDLATSQSGYLNNGVYWWLMTPYDANNVRNIADNGYMYYTLPSNGRGVRPVINLKENIGIYDGTGVKTDPYILENDNYYVENIPVLLSTRYSGEYVDFNSELYRIVGVEKINDEVLTKIIAVDSPTSLENTVFDSDTENYITNFNEADIKTDLESYYQQLKTSNITSYNMIQPNTTWYLGQVNVGGHYKASICQVIEQDVSVRMCQKINDTQMLALASIALPRVGEMFTSPINKGIDLHYWTLTPTSLSTLRVINSVANLSSQYPTTTIGVRPSMYLKQNVVIASDNIGNGTYEHPYSIELGS